MVHYLFLAFAPIVLNWLMQTVTGVNIDENQKYKKRYCIIVGIVIFFMFALRSMYVGSDDSANYYNHWVNLSKLDFSGFLYYAKHNSMEKGFLLSAWCLSHIFPNGQFIFVFSGLLFAVSVMYFIYKNSNDVLMSTEMFICLGLFGFMMQGMRQAIAMSICLLSIGLVKKRKLVLFLLTVLLATLFHKTAILFVAVYFFYGKKLNKNTAFIFFSVGAFIMVFSDLIVSKANDLFNREYSSVATSGGFVATAIYLIIVFIGTLAAVYYVKGEKNKNIEFEYDISFFLFLCFLGCVFYIMRYTAVRVSQRISFYFMFSQMIVLPKSLFMFDEKSRKFLKPLIIVLCLLLNIYRLPREGLLPYLFFWQ